ncbi:MAG: amidohydrolase family protein [Alphaproteobacteria bacterium]|jgi:OH-DDVA meta-cleavage compound hydrolase
MIIDIHAHFSAPEKLFAYKANILASRGRSRGAVKLSDDEILGALNKKVHGGNSHLEQLDEVGTDIQIISPRPYQLMHSEKPESLVHNFTESCNNLTARQCELFPDKFVGMASLPQNMGVSPSNSLEEMERCVKELNMKGFLLNPDPSEGMGEAPPGLGDEYWYPIYEKLVEYDMPVLIHAAGCRSHRHDYTLNFIIEESIAIVNVLDSKVFEDFPKLKMIICHGGGAIPYQIGRFRAGRIKRNSKIPFEESFRQLYFDTALYTPDALEMLFRWAGTDRCMFGTERPGAGTAKDPITGTWMDDTKPMIEGIASLTADDKKKIFEDNAKDVFNLDL